MGLLILSISIYFNKLTQNQYYLHVRANYKSIVVINDKILKSRRYVSNHRNLRSYFLVNTFTTIKLF